MMKSKAWNVVSTLFLFLLFFSVVTIAALWFLSPILSITTDWAWVDKTVALFWELGLYK